MTALDPAAVRARAHALWMKNGKRDGHATDDWHQAERELRAEASAKAAPATSAAVVKAAVPAAPSPQKPAGSAPATPVQQPTFRKGKKRR